MFRSSRPLLLAAACVAAGPALAQGGYPTCAQARATVMRHGAAVIHTAPHIYDRYVANAGYCMPGEVAASTPVATRDASACFIGFVCKQGPLWDHF